MLIVEGWIRFAPGQVEELRTAAQTLVAATREEPGCISYALSADLAEPDILRIAEIWRDEAALQAHTTAPHVGAFASRMAALKILGMCVKSYNGENHRTLMEL